MVEWDEKELLAVPRQYDTTLVNAPGVKPLFFENIPFKGNATRVFAWLGLPPGASAEHPVPAMVLVHGGGATALPRWVRYWNLQGYAAIALDTCGGIAPQDQIDSPWNNGESWPRHEWSGPEGWGNFEKSGEPIADQWIFHAVHAVTRAHSLLRALPEVKEEQVGVTGVSWGGVLSCIAAGLDPRFAAVAPVYGCGFLERETSLYDGEQPGRRKIARWLKLWDPSRYLKRADMPILWVVGTNDAAFSLHSVMESALCPTGPVYLSVKVRMEHGHAPLSEEAPEVLDFMNAVIGRHPMPPRGDKPKLRHKKLVGEFDTVREIAKAELLYTRASGYWSDRTWNSAAAEFDPRDGKVKALLPPETRAAFFNVTDKEGRIYSSLIREF